jgi:O-antigen/teichoic acid export membrane protein
MSIRRHTIYNVLGVALPLALSLVTIPVYLGLIGEARYGILAIAWVFLGYFGLFDLGLGRATAQRIASIEEAKSQEVATTFWTALFVNSVLGVIGAIIIWPIATYLFTII